LIIWYVHGAGASNRSFAWLHEQLGEFPAQFFHYDLDETAQSVIQRLSYALTQDGRAAMLVGHSLGGIAATACSAANVTRLVTLCAPFGGVRYVDLMSLFSRHPLLSDLRSHGRLLSSVRATHLTRPHLAIVGTQGLPFFAEDNDGVVTVASQTALSGVRYTKLPLNHFEVLLSRDVADLIRSFAGEHP
jgi:pimeloyl-ACP methyl ester carboxylesterase